MLKLDRFDTLTVVGLGLVCSGVWLIYHPAALIVGGIVMLLAGIRGSAPKAGGN